MVCWGSLNDPDHCDFRYENMTNWGRKMFVSPGVIRDGQLLTNDLVEINLGIRILLGSSYYEDWEDQEMFVTRDALGNPVDRRHPWNQHTIPRPGKRNFEDKYSWVMSPRWFRSEEHTSELQSRVDVGCRLLLEKKVRRLAAMKRQRTRQPLVNRRCSHTAAILFFFNDTATTAIYTLSLHDALPICPPSCLDPPASSPGDGAPRALSRPCFRSEEHTSELQSRVDLVCRLLLEKKKRYTLSYWLSAAIIIILVSEI